MTYDASNRKSIRRAEKASEAEERNRIAYVKHIMSEPFGRAWMLQLLTKCHIFHTSFVAGAPDATAFKLGEQNLGLQIFGDVAAFCPNEYTLMMQEQATKDQANGRRDNDDASAEPTGTIADPGRDDNRSVNGDASDDDPARYVSAEGFVTFGQKSH